MLWAKFGQSGLSTKWLYWRLNSNWKIGMDFVSNEPNIQYETNLEAEEVRGLDA